MRNLSSLRLWLHGLGAAAIGGAVTTLGAIPVVHFDKAGIDTLKSAAITGAFVGVIAYFKQSPLPSAECKDASAAVQSDLAQTKSDSK